MLLAAGIMSPNTSRRKPPTVTNQPRTKYANGSVPHAWATADMHFWYAGESTKIDFMMMNFDTATIAIPASTNPLFMIITGGAI